MVSEGKQVEERGGDQGCGHLGVMVHKAAGMQHIHAQIQTRCLREYLCGSVLYCR